MLMPVSRSESQALVAESRLKSWVVGAGWLGPSWASLEPIGPVLDLSWACLGPVLRLSWAGLGPSWASLGPLACLEPSWACLGPVLGLSWASWVDLGVVLGSPGAVLGFLGATWAVLGYLAPILGRLCGHL